MSQKHIKAKDAIASIGTKITSDEGRDAIHIAVVAVEAAQTMHPGQHIGLIGPRLASTEATKHVGIVDPYLKSSVQNGDQFWMFLYPRTITSLHHVWEHPDIPNEQVPSMIDHHAATTSMAWMENFATGYGYTAEAMISFATNYLNKGTYLIGGANLEGERVPDEFWVHYENIVGRKVDEEDQGSFFSCVC